ncbi:hypothetical protein JOQ06_021215 [Pogonophryne albipinna]|uniref:Uncharacterized protein n=1 Tax=Pogonophryne albipinna TaxID=1090488 RepID=A0AAD6BRH8_9TELE|nr:hypothetical protein JOQ06_021215 [Pogonophryne albipinna]
MICSEPNSGDILECKLLTSDDDNYVVIPTIPKLCQWLGGVTRTGHCCPTEPESSSLRSAKKCNATLTVSPKEKTKSDEMLPVMIVIFL